MSHLISSQFGWWPLRRSLMEREPPVPMGPHRKHRARHPSEGSFTQLCSHLQLNPQSLGRLVEVMVRYYPKKTKKGGKVFIYQSLHFFHYHLWKQHLFRIIWLKIILKNVILVAAKHCTNAKTNMLLSLLWSNSKSNREMIPTVKGFCKALICKGFRV